MSIDFFLFTPLLFEGRNNITKFLNVFIAEKKSSRTVSMKEKISRCKNCGVINISETEKDIQFFGKVSIDKEKNTVYFFCKKCGYRMELSKKYLDLLSSFSDLQEDWK